MLRHTHQYARILRHAYKILQDTGEPRLFFRLHSSSQPDPRRYSLPTSDDVAAVIPGGQSAPAHHKIVVRMRDGGLWDIDDGNPAYQVLQYVLLFPFGSHGWEYEMRQREPENSRRTGLPPRISQTQYYAYRLHARANQFPALHLGGRLLQEYIVDSWASADQSRLRYIQTHQNDLRAELSSGLRDAVADENSLKDVGKRVVLPSSYHSGPRYRIQRCQGSLAVGRHYGKIDIFLTMTANPAWPEIQRELLHANLHALCMRDGVCTKGYPKQHRDSTTLSEDGYPNYARSDDGRSYRVRGVDVDNSMIAPYCPMLSARYACHINVEAACSFQPIKYVTKYLHKGEDRTTLALNYDEVQWLLDSRFLSAPESIWRLFHFELYNLHPSVTRLQVHLSGAHFINFSASEDPNIVAERAANERLTLTAFFDANRDD
ncbi:unnamed protein product [Peniophora sp. CBMAI 1063]|nr:unnamed protein product [Peniophora sp. CBMAI 1063]